MPSNEIDMLGAEAWSPLSHRLRLIRCGCVRENLQRYSSVGQLCNVMQAAFAPVTSSSALLFRPDGDLGPLKALCCMGSFY